MMLLVSVVLLACVFAQAPRRRYLRESDNGVTGPNRGRFARRRQNSCETLRVKERTIPYERSGRYGTSCGVCQHQCFLENIEQATVQIVQGHSVGMERKACFFQFNTLLQ